MKCPNCGSENSDSNLFCLKCGCALQDDTEATKSAYDDGFTEGFVNNTNDINGTYATINRNNDPGINEEYENKKKKKKIVNTIIAVVAIIACIAAVLVIVFNLNYNDDSSKSTSTTEETETTETEETTAEPTSTAIPTTVMQTEGNLIKVPSVVGLRSSDATKKIKASGLNFEVMLTESSTVEGGYVISQSPKAGEKVSENESITIYVSKTDNDKQYLYCCASEYVTLRDKASRSGKELAKIKSRERVEFLGISGEFYDVIYDGKRGYVLKDFFSTDPDAPLNYDKGDPTTKPVEHIYCIASEYATLRDRPSTSGKALDRIGRYEEVELISEEGNFYYVSYYGQKGYVLKDYFSFDPDAPLNYGDD